VQFCLIVPAALTLYCVVICAYVGKLNVEMMIVNIFQRRNRHCM